MKFVLSGSTVVCKKNLCHINADGLYVRALGREHMRGSGYVKRGGTEIIWRLRRFYIISQ